MHLGIYLTTLILATSLTSSVARASEVTVPYKGVTLNANLELAAGKTIDDGVILITHGGPEYNRAELYAYLQELFKEAGYSTIAINISHGIDNRHGRYDCKSTSNNLYTDAANEIGVWVNWLARQGVKHVILLGHSRGGSQTALYAAEHDDDSVQAVVLLAPDTRETNDAPAYLRRYHKALAPILTKAQQLVKEGKGSTILSHTDFLFCRDTSVTADTFVSYYGPDPRLDSSYLVPRIRKPTLIVLAGGDQIVVNDKKFLALANDKRVQVKTVADANHFFRDLYADEAVDTIVKYLRSVEF